MRCAHVKLNSRVNFVKTDVIIDVNVWYVGAYNGNLFALARSSLSVCPREEIYEGRRRYLLLGLRNIWTEISRRYRQDERTTRAGRMTGGMQIDSNSWPPLSQPRWQFARPPRLFSPYVPWRIRHPRVPLSWNPRMHRMTLIILIYRRLRYYPPESKAGGSIPLIRIMGLICIHDASVASKDRIATEVAL